MLYCSFFWGRYQEKHPRWARSEIAGAGGLSLRISQVDVSQSSKLWNTQPSLTREHADRLGRHETSACRGDPVIALSQKCFCPSKNSVCRGLSDIHFPTSHFCLTCDSSRQFHTDQRVKLQEFAQQMIKYGVLQDLVSFGFGLL